MKISYLVLAGIFLQGIAVPVRAADDPTIERLATCRDSWRDMQKSDPAGLKKIGDHLNADFSPSGNDPFIVPKKNLSIAGLRVKQVFPNSVGMGVGFSVTVTGRFDETRKAIEKRLGKRLGHCETGDDMRMCELEIAKERTVTLMAEDSPKATETLVGCYYLYEK
jgi:hypothetical protein